MIRAGTHHNTVIRNVFINETPSPYNHIITDFHIIQDVSSRTYKNVIAYLDFAISILVFAHLIHVSKHFRSIIMSNKPNITSYMNIIPKCNQVRFCTKIPWLKITMITLFFELVMLL